MIKAICLSEFDLDRGPEITFIHPPTSRYATLVKQNFKEFSYFLCPEDTICDQLLSLKLDERHIVVCWPHVIYNSKLNRNKVQYNTSIVMKNCLLESYQLSIKKMFDKLCRFFEEAEKDHRLFSDSLVRGCLEAMLEQLYVDLNSRNECLLRLENHFAYLTLHPAKNFGEITPQKKREINNKIPIMQKKTNSHLPLLEGRDQLLVCILKFINGKNSIFQIKKKALKRMTSYKPQEQNLTDLIYKKLLD